MPDLTIRNLTAHPLTFTRLTSLFTGPPQPVPIKASNITDVKNITANITSLSTSVLSRTPIIKKRITVPEPPAPAPSLSDHQIDITLSPFTSTLTPKIPIAVWTNYTLEITYPDSHSFTLRIPYSTSSAPLITEIPRSSGTVHALHALYHPSPKPTLTITPSSSLNAWMSHLPSSLPISALSIPGTHNAPTHHVALPSVRCQAHGIPTQLNNGIRFLDVRVQPDSDFALVHGVFPISVSGTKKLSTLLDDVYAFLTANPSETVIISLKREGRDVGVDDPGFSELLWQKFIAPKAYRWWLSPKIPTLGEARGKIVLFRRFKRHTKVLAMGLDAESWRYNCARDVHGVVCVQDFCEVLETENIELKTNHVKEHLRRAAKETKPEGGDGLLYVNFLSASNFWKVGCWPDRIAKKINPEVQRWLSMDHEAGKGTGVVILDFVGEDGEWGICRLVVGMNAALMGRE